MVMYEAMRYARLAIANAPTAAQTWGAYQHYGDPFFRLLDAEALTEAWTTADGATTTRTAKKDASDGSAVEIGTSAGTGTATVVPSSELKASASPNDEALTGPRNSNGDDSAQGSPKPDEPAPTLTASPDLAAVAALEQPQAARENAPSIEPRTESRAAKRRPRRAQRGT
jgi:hypothetical protein